MYQTIAVDKKLKETMWKPCTICATKRVLKVNSILFELHFKITFNCRLQRLYTIFILFIISYLPMTTNIKLINQ